MGLPSRPHPEEGGGGGIRDGVDGLRIADERDEEEERGAMSVDEEFAHHRRGLARLNHGSFGSCPRTVLAAQQAWARWWQRQPDECYFGPLEQALRRARQAVADAIRAPLHEVVLLENVTAAASMVALDAMWAFADGRYRRGDSILTLNFSYGAVKNAFKACPSSPLVSSLLSSPLLIELCDDLQAYAARAGGRVVEVALPFPVSSEDEVLHAFEAALKREREEHPGSVVRLAVVDHIVSMPTMILPVRELVRLCRRHGVEGVFVDGAHGLGNLQLDMGEIDADYYACNLHKWMFAPTTAAFMHCKSKHLARLHHPVVSHLYGEGVVAECSWVGTRDYSAFVAVPEGIQFATDVAGSVLDYSQANHRQVVAMAEMLAGAWGTSLGTPPEMCAAMAMIALPPPVNVHSQAELLALRRRIRDEYGVDVHLFFAGNASASSGEEAKITTYVRISHQVYNKPEEYVRLRDAISDLASKS